VRNAPDSILVTAAAHLPRSDPLKSPTVNRPRLASANTQAYAQTLFSWHRMYSVLSLSSIFE